MSEIYCPNCSRLIGDRSRRCPRCKHLNLEIPEKNLFLLPVVSCIVGAVITGLYARVVFLAWPHWCKYFTMRGYAGDDNAEEAAILVGIAVFILTTILAALSMKLRPAKSTLVRR